MAKLYNYQILIWLDEPQTFTASNMTELAEILTTNGVPAKEPNIRVKFQKSTETINIGTVALARREPGKPKN